MDGVQAEMPKYISMNKEDLENDIRAVNVKYWATPTINDCIDELVKVYEKYYSGNKNEICPRTLSGKHSFWRPEKKKRVCSFCDIIDNSENEALREKMGYEE